MNEVLLPAAIEPDEWFVVFHTKATTRLLSWLALGRFKHVSAFAYYPGFKAWLLYDVQLTGTRLILLAHGDEAKATIAAITAGCTIVKVRRQLTSYRWHSRLGFYCVPAVKHLLGVRCATMRPDGLYRHLLRDGGIRIDGRR